MSTLRVALKPAVTMKVAQISKSGGDFEFVGVRPKIETYPLEHADQAYARMMSGQAQFRVVLTM